LPKAEESLEENLGKTLNIYRELAIALNSFPKGRTLSIKDLAEKAQVHYNTAKKALIFFHQVESVVPKFQVQEGEFRVVSKPDALKAVEGLFESLDMRVLTKMMLVNAIDSDKALKLDDLLTEEERGILPTLIERGYVNSIEGQYFLSSRGQSLGSMGLSRIVKLDIPLPWENRTSPSQREVQPKISWGSPQGDHIFLLRDRSCSKWTIYKRQQVAKMETRMCNRKWRCVSATH